ncbi:uncharacterized protein HHUB_2203 [Halobacterium hubeiense]|uniref:Transcription factor CBF/NF-Y/archaeal histone domain-containing protein n=1 Tax=Halobacterium hubeiense TaxID=1407499 RepID=A0A0U5H1G4_9EURY|nr:hypothetical protein [Halobacterium hubeiense]CQH55232.1 uncharacterized protein HHUB_2203 [Halobacterium hubeiense]
MSEDPFDEHDPIKVTPLRGLMRDMHEQNVGDGTDDYFKARMEKMIEVAWYLSAQSAAERGSARVQPTDIDSGFKRLLEPSYQLKRAVDETEETYRKLREISEEAPLFADELEVDIDE